MDADQRARATEAMQKFLEAMGMNLERLGMEDTPRRVTEMYAHLFSGMEKDTKEIWGELFDADSDGMIAVRALPFCSMCEHHLVPFFGTVSIVYRPAPGRVAGLGKFTKLVEIISRRPQLQERMTRQIAEAIAEDLGARGVLVVTKAQQLCMSMRGELAYGAATLTAETRGIWQTDAEARREAWQLLECAEKEGKA